MEGPPVWIVLWMPYRRPGDHVLRLVPRLLRAEPELPEQRGAGSADQQQRCPPAHHDEDDDAGRGPGRSSESKRKPETRQPSEDGRRTHERRCERRGAELVGGQRLGGQVADVDGGLHPGGCRQQPNTDDENRQDDHDDLVAGDERSAQRGEHEQAEQSETNGEDQGQRGLQSLLPAGPQPTAQEGPLDPHQHPSGTPGADTERGNHSPSNQVS